MQIRHHDGQRTSTNMDERERAAGCEAQSMQDGVVEAVCRPRKVLSSMVL
jgi:hypothetical protein